MIGAVCGAFMTIECKPYLQGGKGDPEIGVNVCGLVFTCFVMTIILWALKLSEII